MSEDMDDILRQTWARSIDPVVKTGYMDGASDGQIAIFQESFNIGYEQGVTFGSELGFREAISRMQQLKTDVGVQDSHKHNCQICINVVKAQEKVENLYDIQKKKNCDYLLRNNSHLDE